MSAATSRVDLNADVGELPLGQDPALMRVITSANIACGFHAGSPQLMRATVALAKAHGVAVGAHSGFDDADHFGRRELRVSPEEVEDLVLYQIGALAAIAAAQGVRLSHVKAHGALYNMAARDRLLADALARATAAFDRSLVFVGLAGSALIEAGKGAGLRTASEVFADRAYNADGSLVSRERPGAVIHDVDTAARRAVQMAVDGTVEAMDGETIRLRADTICLHGDTPDAARLAVAVRRALEAAGVTIARASS
jgi:UPF0271 protein